MADRPEISKFDGMKKAAHSVTRSEVEMNKVPKSKGISTKIPNIIARGKINPDDAKTAELKDALKTTNPLSLPKLPDAPKLGPRV